MKHQRKLRNLWLNPQYQLRYVFWITFSGLLLVGLQLCVFYFFTRENYTILVDLSPMTDEAKQQLYKELWQILSLLVGGSAVFLGLVSFMGLIFSHRTAGPLYHLKKVFDDVKAGDMGSRVHLRPNDDFQDVAKSFNDMMDHVQREKK